MSNNVKGAFTVRFVRNGDTIYVVREIVKANGDGTSLYQAIDPTTGELSVNWGTPANQPIIKLRVMSCRGYPVSINSVTWAYDGHTLTFNSAAESSGDYEGWHLCSTTGYASKFAVKITVVGGESVAMFRILDNIATTQDMTNKQVTYTIDYTCNSIHDTVTESVDIEIQSAGSNSYRLVIGCASYILPYTDSNSVVHESVNLTIATLLYGVKNVTLGSDGNGNTYSVEWYQDGVLLSGKTGLTLTVNRNNQNDGNPFVDGASVFVAKLKKNGVVVAQDAQSILDMKDEYRVEVRPRQNYSAYIDENNSTQLQAQLIRQTPSGSVSNVAGATYVWTLYNMYGTVTGENLSGQNVTVTANHAKCEIIDENGHGTGNYHYGDVEAAVTATYNV